LFASHYNRMRHRYYEMIKAKCFIWNTEHTTKGFLDSFIIIIEYGNY